MKLRDLPRRLRLARELLREYEEQELRRLPPGEARRIILEFADTYQTAMRSEGTTAWRDAVKERAAKYPPGAAS